jgi:hypothetical protein
MSQDIPDKLAKGDGLAGGSERREAIAAQR